jgi:hypothetical protein
MNIYIIYINKFAIVELFEKTRGRRERKRMIESE